MGLSRQRQHSCTIAPSIFYLEILALRLCQTSLGYGRPLQTQYALLEVPPAPARVFWELPLQRIGKASKFNALSLSGGSCAACSL
jgi:hypothetical protein